MIKMRGSVRKWVIGSMAAVTATVGLVAGGAGTAFADPSTTLVGTGSDTTQDVMNGIANAIGFGIIGSWDAVDPIDPTNQALLHEKIRPKPGCTFARPNGSGEGLLALRLSLGSTTQQNQTTLNPAPGLGCVDFARSSSGPAALDQSNSGALVYIPFAMDAVTTATGPATGTGATAIVDADKFTLADLTNLYGNCTAVTPAGSTVSYDPTGTVTDATHQPIHLYAPQNGSGTTKFWKLTLLGSSSASFGTCVKSSFTVNGSSVSVEEHDGTVFANDPDAIGPFSIAQWVSQRNGNNDRRHGAVVHFINGASPCGSATNPSNCATGSMNVSFPVRREVYNIVPFAKVDPNSAGDPLLKSMFSGSQSSICQQSTNILGFGFALLNNAPLGHHCGDVVNGLRAFDPASDPV